MPTTQQLRSRLADKLKELFQLNQPDLDFGFYRIMHAKSEQVTRFLEDYLDAIKTGMPRNEIVIAIEHQVPDQSAEITGRDQ